MSDKIITHPATDEYRENWERIFGGPRGKWLGSFEGVEDGRHPVPPRNAVKYRGNYYEADAFRSAGDVVDAIACRRGEIGK